MLKDIQLIYPNLEIVIGDALEFDISKLGNDLHIVSNLPYKIGTQLLINWLKKAKFIKSMTLMLQREVVNRICAKPNSKEYGRISVISQLVCIVQKCFDVKPKAFFPSPKVTSSVINLVPHNTHTYSSETLSKLELITRFAFGKRRKMIKTSLKELKSDIDIILHKLKINSMLRAENLSPQDYLALIELL